MSDLNFDEIPSTERLPDPRKGRVPPPRRARLGSENDVIDGAPETPAKDDPVEQKEEEVFLISPKPVTSPMSFMPMNLMKDIKSAVEKKRNSEPIEDTKEPEVTPKEPGLSSPTAATRIEDAIAHKVIKVPGLMPELQNNIRIRPKTVDLGDLSISKTKKSPAPPVPKIIEEVKPVSVPEATVATPVKQELPIVRDLQSPDGPVSPTRQVIRSQRVEKKQLVTESRINPDDGLKIKKTTETVTVQKQMKSNVQISEKSQIIDKSSKNIEDVSVANVEKVKSTKIQDTGVMPTTLVEKKTISVESKSSATSAKILASEPTKLPSSATSAKILASGPTKLPSAATSAKILTSEPTKIPSAKILASEPTKLPSAAEPTKIEVKLTAGKLAERSQIVVTPIAANTDKKNTADSLSGIQSVNSNRTISESNISLSHKSKSIDKNVNIDGDKLIKTNTTVDKKAVREVTNDLMEESYRIFKQGKGNKIDVSVQSKDTVAENNLKTEAATKSTFTNIKKETNVKVETATITLLHNKDKEMNTSSNRESKKDAPNSNLKVEKELDTTPAATTKVSKPNEREKEKATVITKIDQESKTGVSKNISSIKTLPQVTKHIITAQKFVSQNNSAMDNSVKIDDKNKMSDDSKVKKRSSWIENSSTENLSKQNTKISSADNGKSSTEDKPTNDRPTNNIFNKFSSFDAFKYNADKQSSLSSDKVLSKNAASTTLDVKKVDVTETPVKSIEASIEKSVTQTSKASFKFNMDKQRSLSSDKVLSKNAVSSTLDVKKVELSETPVKSIEKSDNDKPLAQINKTSLFDSFKFSTDKQRSVSSEKVLSKTAVSSTLDVKKVDLSETPVKSIERSNDKLISQASKASSFASLKFSMDKDRSLSSDNVLPKVAASSSLDVKKVDVSQTPVVRNENSKSITQTNLNQPRIVSTNNAYAKSASKEDFSSTASISLQVKPKKLETNTTVVTEVVKSASEAQTDAIVNNFRIRNNIGKSNSIENLNSNNQVLPKPTESAKDVTDSKAIVNESDPFRANRKNNIFRRLSDAKNVSKEAPTTEAKTINADKETKDVQSADKEVSIKIRATWKTAANMTTVSNEGKETKPNISPSQSISRSVEVKKDVAATPTDAPAVTRGLPDVSSIDISAKVDRTSTYNISRSTEVKKDTTETNADVTITKGSAFANPARASTYNDLLKRSMNKLSPDKDELKLQPKNESVSKKENNLTEIKEVAVKTNVPDAVESRWKRPVTLAFQKEEPKTSTATLSINPATVFLQGNKISKSMFENKATSTNLKSTPTSSLTSLPEIEPVAKQSPATPPNQSKTSPTARHESPIFNKMFLPKSTFRSPTSVVNKSTEDISAASMRGSSSFRQNRPQTSTGNEHVTIQRTMSAAPKVESTIKEKNESAAADFFQEWKNKRKAIP